MTHTNNTSAWVFQVWASFLVSFGATLVGIYFLPSDLWTKGFVAMGLMFTVGSTFTLAKTVRDNHEAGRLVNRVREAKAEQIIKDYEEVGV